MPRVTRASICERNLIAKASVSSARGRERQADCNREQDILSDGSFFTGVLAAAAFSPPITYPCNMSRVAESNFDAPSQMQRCLSGRLHAAARYTNALIS